jgi:hypothetical protein
MATTSPDDFGYVVVARVIDRSHAARLERKDVDAESLAAFLSLRDASVAPDPAQLAQAALAWAREALGKHLGDADEVTFKVTIFRPKGFGTLRCRHVLARRIHQPAAATPEAVCGIRKRWRLMIRKRWRVQTRRLPFADSGSRRVPTGVRTGVRHHDSLESTQHGGGRLVPG